MSPVGDWLGVRFDTPNTTEFTPVRRLWAITLPSGALVMPNPHLQGIPSFDHTTSDAMNTGWLLVALDSCALTRFAISSRHGCGKLWAPYVLNTSVFASGERVGQK